MKKHMNQELINLLNRVGLNQYESKIYLALLNENSATASEVSARAGIPRPRAYDVLEKLSKEGFVSVQPGRPVRFLANPIDEAFEALKNKKKQEHLKSLEQINKIKTTLSEKVKNIKKEDYINASDFVYVMKKRNNINSKIEALINNAQESIHIAGGEEELKDKISSYASALKKASDRGVKIHIITPKAKTIKAHAKKYNANVKEKNHSHRFIIADDNVMLFLTPEGEQQEVGAWIKSPFVAKNLKTMFE